MLLGHGFVLTHTLTCPVFEFIFLISCRLICNPGLTRLGGIRMTIYLYLATTIGLFIVTQTNGNWNIVRHTLADKSLTSVAVSDGVIVAGSTEGIWRSADNGETWEKADTDLTIRYVRWLAAVTNASNAFLAGTEPAGIFLSTTGAASWRSSPEVGELRDAFGWFLPYSPEAGCVRGFTVAQSGPRPGRIYAAVEVGGVLVSEDNGKTWKLVEGSDGKPDLDFDSDTLIHPDVHSITVHPSSSDLVTAATGGGLYRSTDGGKSWINIYRCYVRAVWVDPSDPQHIIAGPADGVSRNGRIEESFDGGKQWQEASKGMQTPWRRHMVERFTQVGADLFAVLSNGELWLMRSGQSQWNQMLPETASVKAMATSH